MILRVFFKSIHSIFHWLYFKRLDITWSAPLGLSRTDTAQHIIHNHRRVLQSLGTEMTRAFILSIPCAKSLDLELSIISSSLTPIFLYLVLALSLE